MRIVSYNIHGGKNAHGIDSLTEIAATLQALNADVILLQEVDRRLMRSRFRDQAALLARATGTTYRFHGRLRFLWSAFGNAILTRQPIRHSHRLLLPASGGEPRGAVGVELESGLAVWCTHLGLHEKWRQTQLAALARVVRKAKGPVIVGGDFNARFEDEEVQKFMQDAGLIVLSNDEPTFPARNAHARIDFLFGRGVYSQDAGVVAATGSDHCAVWGDCRLLDG